MPIPDRSRRRLAAIVVAVLLAGCGGERGSPASGPAAAAATPAAAPGASAYSVCIPCHLATGQGIPGAYPTLVGTSWVTGDPDVLIKLTLHGLDGPVVVNGRQWKQAMPKWEHLGDQQLADLLTYVRTSWGNSAGPISAADVARVRAATAGRSTPWTAAELGAP